MPHHYHPYNCKKLKLKLTLILQETKNLVKVDEMSIDHFCMQTPSQSHGRYSIIFLQIKFTTSKHARTPIYIDVKIFVSNLYIIPQIFPELQLTYFVKLNLQIDIPAGIPTFFKKQKWIHHETFLSI